MKTRLPKTIDQMKSKLAQEDDPEMRQKILNATLDDVVDETVKLSGYSSGDRIFNFIRVLFHRKVFFI